MKRTSLSLSVYQSVCTVYLPLDSYDLFYYIISDCYQVIIKSIISLFFLTWQQTMYQGTPPILNDVNGKEDITICKGVLKNNTITNKLNLSLLFWSYVTNGRVNIKYLDYLCSKLISVWRMVYVSHCILYRIGSGYS